MIVFFWRDFISSLFCVDEDIPVNTCEIFKYTETMKVVDVLLNHIKWKNNQ